MLLKAGVNFDGVQPELVWGLAVAGAVYRKLGYTLTITSLTDGIHNPGSLHPKGLAADLRVINIPSDKRQEVFEAIKLALEPHGFDVVWEGGVEATPATTGAHIHIEYQPKANETGLSLV